MPTFSSLVPNEDFRLIGVVHAVLPLSLKVQAPAVTVAEPRICAGVGEAGTSAVV